MFYTKFTQSINWPIKYHAMWRLILLFKLLYAVTAFLHCTDWLATISCSDHWVKEADMRYYMHYALVIETGKGRGNHTPFKLHLRQWWQIWWSCWLCIATKTIKGITRLNLLEIFTSHSTTHHPPNAPPPLPNPM